MNIDATFSVVSDPPGQCVANYEVVFTVSNPPGGSVTVNYSWHLTTGRIIPAKPITLKEGTSQTETYQEFSNGSKGDVYVAWSANGASGTSNLASLTISCIK